MAPESSLTLFLSSDAILSGHLHSGNVKLDLISCGVACAGLEASAQWMTSIPVWIISFP